LTSCLETEAGPEALLLRTRTVAMVMFPEKE
jgi:hypothetical protein